MIRVHIQTSEKKTQDISKFPTSLKRLPPVSKSLGPGHCTFPHKRSAIPLCSLVPAASLSPLAVEQCPKRGKHSSHNDLHPASAMDRTVSRPNQVLVRQRRRNAARAWYVWAPSGRWPSTSAPNEMVWARKKS